MEWFCRISYESYRSSSTIPRKHYEEQGREDKGSENDGQQHRQRLTDDVEPHNNERALAKRSKCRPTRIGHFERSVGSWTWRVRWTPVSRHRFWPNIRVKCCKRILAHWLRMTKHNVRFGLGHTFYFYELSWRQFEYINIWYIYLWGPSDGQLSASYLSDQFAIN